MMPSMRRTSRSARSMSAGPSWRAPARAARAACPSSAAEAAHLLHLLRSATGSRSRSKPLAGLDLVGELLRRRDVDALLRPPRPAPTMSPMPRMRAGVPLGIEHLEAVDLLADAGELDRRAGDLPHRQRRAAARVAVELGQDDAGQRQRLLERLGGVDRVLALHRVDHEQRLDRLRAPRAARGSRPSSPRRSPGGRRCRRSARRSSARARGRAPRARSPPAVWSRLDGNHSAPACARHRLAAARSPPAGRRRPRPSAPSSCASRSGAWPAWPWSWSCPRPAGRPSGSPPAAAPPGRGRRRPRPSSPPARGCTTPTSAWPGRERADAPPAPSALSLTRAMKSRTTGSATSASSSAMRTSRSMSCTLSSVMRAWPRIVLTSRLQAIGEGRSHQASARGRAEVRKYTWPMILSFGADSQARAGVRGADLPSLAALVLLPRRGAAERALSRRPAHAPCWSAGSRTAWRWSIDIAGIGSDVPGARFGFAPALSLTALAGARGLRAREPHAAAARRAPRARRAAARSSSSSPGSFPVEVHPQAASLVGAAALAARHRLVRPVRRRGAARAAAQPRRAADAPRAAAPARRRRRACRCCASSG